MNNLESRSGQIHRGLGVVVRWPGIAIVVPSDADHDGAVDEMFQQLGTDPTAEHLMAAINSLLASNRLNAVGVLLESDGGLLGLTCGPVEILTDGEVALDGAGGVTRSPIPPGSGTLTIRATNLAKAADPVAPYDLRRGIAPGAGVTLGRLLIKSAPAEPSAPPVVQTFGGPQNTAAADEDGAPHSDALFEEVPSHFGSPAAPADAPTASEIPSGGRSFFTVPAEEASSSDPATPLPYAQDEQSSTEVPLIGDLVEVEGILCSRKHFNNPANANCMVCGLPLAHLADDLVRAPRPTLGFIVFDNGSTYGLDRSYVIGREPHPTGDGTAQPLVIRSENETLSRTHIELRLVGWQVQLVDLESTNGTYLWNPNSESWDKIAPHQPVELKSGVTVAIGRRTFVFEGVGGQQAQRGQ